MAVVLATAGLYASSAGAATFTVSNTSDATGTCPTPTSCSLRQAITSANATPGDDTINFNVPAGSTISLTNGALTVSPTTASDHTTVSGPAAKSLTVRRDSGSPNASVFVFSTGTSSFSGLTVSGGSVGALTGGGLVNNSGSTLTLDSVVISANSADAGGGAGGAAGGIANVGGALTIRNSTITGNTVTNSGTGQSGGGITNTAGGALTLVNDTISGNRVTGSGPRDAGGLTNISGTTTLINATIAANSADNGAGGITGDGSGSIRLANTIVAANSGNPAPDCLSEPVNPRPMTSQGSNFIGVLNDPDPYGACFEPQGDPGKDRFGAGPGRASPSCPAACQVFDPRLGPLADNGGPTPTMAPDRSSEVVDRGNPNAVSDSAPPTPPALIPCPSTDQRGITRPQGPDVGPFAHRCDIGAVEVVCTACGFAPPPGPVVVAVVSALRISPSAFPAASAGPSATASKKRTSKPGAMVSYLLNQPASVRFSVQQAQPGRRLGRGKRARCVAPNRRNAKAPRCSRTVTLAGSFTMAGHLGANRFRFTGRMAGKKLKPGAYRLVATPSVAGRSGRAATTPFRILRN